MFRAGRPAKLSAGSHGHAPVKKSSARARNCLSLATQILSSSPRVSAVVHFYLTAGHLPLRCSGEHRSPLPPRRAPASTLPTCPYAALASAAPHQPPRCSGECRLHLCWNGCYNERMRCWKASVGAASGDFFLLQLVFCFAGINNIFCYDPDFGSAFLLEQSKFLLEPANHFATTVFGFYYYRCFVDLCYIHLHEIVCFSSRFFATTML